MSNRKRKSFTFEESDLKWISPLLSEWEKDNEGMKKGELITQLLKEYKESLGPSKSELILEKIQGDINRLKTGLDSHTSTSRTRIKDAFGETKIKLNKAASKIAMTSKQVIDEIHSQVESQKRDD